MRRFPRYPKRPHQSGQARIVVDGRTIYLGAHDSPESWREYERRLSSWRRGDSSADSETCRRIVTVADAVAAWLDHCRERYAGKQELLEQRLVFTVVDRLYGSTTASDFGPRQLEAVQRAIATGSWLRDDERRAVGRNGRNGAVVGCNRRVTNRHVVRVRTGWRWLERNELVPPGAVSRLATVEPLRVGSPIARPATRRRPATADAVERVANAIYGEHWRYRPASAMLRIQWLTGMRSAEVRGMRVGELDRVGVEIDGVRVWFYRPTAHKNTWREDEAGESQPRVIPLGPECQKILSGFLTDHVAANPRAFVFRPRRCNVLRGFSAASYPQAVRRGAERVGVDLRPYDCRHGAKQRITREHGADAARAVLGHKTISTTQHYGEIDVEHAARVAAKGA